MSYYAENKKLAEEVVNAYNEGARQVLDKIGETYPNNPVVAELVDGLKKSLEEAVLAAEYNIIPVVTRHEQRNDRRNAQYQLYKEACRREEKND